MNRRSILRNLALVAIASATAIFSTAGASATPVTDGTLSVGETYRPHADLKITFLAVTKESRCPINATCISAGNAEILLRVKAGKQPAKNYKLNTNRKPLHQVIPIVYPEGMAGIPKSYLLSIGELNPLPFAGKKTKQSDYRLKLAIQVAQ